MKLYIQLFSIVCDLHYQLMLLLDWIFFLHTCNTKLKTHLNHFLQWCLSNSYLLDYWFEIPSKAVIHTNNIHNTFLPILICQ